jgi:hypothetical protein
MLTMPPVSTRDDLISLLRRVEAPDHLVADAVEAYSLTLPEHERMDVVERYHDPDLRPIVLGVVYVVVQAVVAAQVVGEKEEGVWRDFFDDTVREVGRMLIDDDAVLRGMAAVFLTKLRADALEDLGDDAGRAFIARLDAVQHELS